MYSFHRMVLFFFKQKTAYEMRISDWSSYVCSSDLLYIGMMPLRLRGRLKTSRLVEAARELAIGIVFELGGDDRPLSHEEQELVILAQRADFIRREQGPRKMLLAERYAGFVAVDRAASSRSMSNRACSPASSAMPSIARLARASASSSRRMAASAGVPRVKSSARTRSEEHTSELQSLMRISYAVFCLKKKKKTTNTN